MFSVRVPLAATIVGLGSSAAIEASSLSTKSLVLQQAPAQIQTSQAQRPWVERARTESSELPLSLLTARLPNLQSINISDKPSSSTAEVVATKELEINKQISQTRNSANLLVESKKIIKDVLWSGFVTTILGFGVVALNLLRRNMPQRWISDKEQAHS